MEKPSFDENTWRESQQLLHQQKLLENKTQQKREERQRLEVQIKKHQELFEKEMNLDSNERESLSQQERAFERDLKCLQKMERNLMLKQQRLIPQLMNAHRHQSSTDNNIVEKEDIDAPDNVTEIDTLFGPFPTFKDHLSSECSIKSDLRINDMLNERNAFLKACNKNRFYANPNYDEPWRVFSRLSKKLSNDIVNMIEEDFTIGVTKFVEDFLETETQIIP